MKTKTESKREKEKQERKSCPNKRKMARGKATSRRKLQRPKAEAVPLKASRDNKIFYADMLKKLKTKASPDEVGSMVGKISDRILLLDVQKDSKLEEESGAI